MRPDFTKSENEKAKNEAQGSLNKNMESRLPEEGCTAQGKNWDKLVIGRK